MPAAELLAAARRRDPVLDWSLLAASVAYAAAGRGDAALDLADAYIGAARASRESTAPPRLAVVLLHRAALLEARSRGPAAAALRTEAADAARRGVAPRSLRIAELLLAGTPGPRPAARRSLTPPGAAPSRTPMSLR